MSKIVDFHKDGIIRFNYDYKPTVGRPILYVENKTWYKFQVDEVQELLDGTFDAICTTLIQIDGVQVKPSIA